MVILLPNRITVSKYYITARCNRTETLAYSCFFQKISESFFYFALPITKRT